jgi:predicted secreted protein
MSASRHELHLSGTLVGANSRGQGALATDVERVMSRSMVRPCGLLLAAGVALSAVPAHAETLLRLSETATVMEHPDELDATLRVDVTAPNPAQAQRQVNTTMEAALAAAKAVAGVTVSTGGYFVWRVGPTASAVPEHWQANQSLELTGHDGAALLKLVGDLQQKGLAVGQLGWRLSEAATRTARAEATRKAIAALRGRAEEAAALLDLRFDSFKEVRLDAVHPQPMPRMMAMSAAASASAPPPSAEAADVSISATAEADVVLLPK